VTVRISHRTPQQEVDAIATKETYEGFKKPVLRSVEGKLFAKKVELDDTDLDEAYCLAFNALCDCVKKGEKVKNPTGFLVEATYHRAIDIYRPLHRDRYTDADPDEQFVDVDMAEIVDDRQKLVRLIGRLKARLNDNERNAVTLCTIHGFRRAEAARMLGMRESAFQKIMDSATVKMGAVVASMEARGCAGDEWAKALRSFALRRMGPAEPDHGRIEEHIEDCASCKRYVRGLEGLAATFPPFGLHLSPVPHGAGIFAHRILAHIYRMFRAGHSSTAAGAVTAQSSATVAGSTATSSGVAGAFAAKAAVVVVAIGAASVPVIVAARHDSTPHPRVPTSEQSAPSPAAAGGEQKTIAVPATISTRGRAAADVRGRARDTMRHGVQGGVPSQSTAASSEFGFEQAGGSQPSQAAPVARSASRSHPAPAPAPRAEQEPRQNGEFGFER
jgi:DNA-directed RNA polymerase specialized sigma24 family protein